ncbi:DUF2141 domain-containing protein [Croceicoccus sp. F390]|uniref:DUF2141 domain-containing protein n=1 Tax=Croceicoccus esteveae TaxID=3075597 RepID=A0ABU2ZI93_9SPHN|nr:DUF2141 domain-containing protein [Croceicoccus sp. F390]MDT0576120.1 DUF2141 domain-containing protein [Croceicoccus sp. F390]
MNFSIQRAGRAFSKKSLAGLAAAAVLSVLAQTPVSAQAALPAGCAGDTSGASHIWVETSGVKSSDGYITLTLYDDQRSKFLAKGGSRDVVRVPAQAGTTRACLKLPDNGIWVIAVYHDENASRKLDRGRFGIPTEGFGFSNNPSTVAGLPSFRSVRLSVPKPGLTTRISMRYL